MRFIFALAFCAGLLFPQINSAQESGAEEKLAKRFSELVQMLKSDQYRVRKEAAEEIAKLGEPAIPLLEKEKGSDDPEVRYRAEEIINQIKRLSAEKRIKEALELCALDEDADELFRQFTSPDKEERYDLLLRVAVKRNKSVVPALKEFLKDRSDEIVDHALAVLCSIIAAKDDSLALETLDIIDRTVPLSTKFGDRLQILSVFADLTNPTVISRMASLRHEDARLILMSRAVLAPQEENVLFFCAFLSDKSELARKLATGGIELILAGLEESGEIRYFNLSDDKKKFLLQNLTRSVKSDDLVVRRVAVKALGHTGAQEAAEAVRPLLQSDDKAIVSESINALGILRDKNAVPALLQILAEKRYNHLPELAESLSRIREESAFEPLLALLEKSDVPSLESVVNALCEMDANRAAPHILKLLAHKNETVRSASAARLSGALKSSVALRTLYMDDLLKKLSSENAFEQTAAAKVVCEVRDPSTLPELKRLARSQDVRVRQAALLPLAMVGGEEERKIIEDALKSEEYLLRVRASQALAYLGDWKHFTAERLVTLQFENDSILVALCKIAWDTGANIVLDPAARNAAGAQNLQSAKVSFTVKRKPLAAVLDEILKTRNLTFQTEFHAIFVTTPERAELLSKFSSSVQKGGENLAQRLSEERVTITTAGEQVEHFFQDLSAKTGINFQISSELSDSLAPELTTIDLSLIEVPLDALLRLVLAPRALTYSCTEKGVLITRTGAAQPGASPDR